MNETVLQYYHMTTFGKKNNVQARGLLCSNMTHFWPVICYKEKAQGLQITAPHALLFVSVDMQKKKKTGEQTENKQEKNPCLQLSPVPTLFSCNFS